MKVIIETIAHKEQRYPTAGDWYFEKEWSLAPAGTGKMSVPEEVLHIKVSGLSDWRMEMLVAVHELVEVLLCKQDGIEQLDVDRFDMEFEKARQPGDDSEPGDDPKAPYVEQHCFATGIERLLAARLAVFWKDYEAAIARLG